MSFRYRGAIRSGTAASYSLSTASGIWTKQTELQAANSNLWPIALGVPGAPSIATAAALTATSATIQIIAPTLNGNSAITQYIATAIPIVNGPSISVISPVITGTSIVGQVLNCSLGTWVTTTTPTYSYQWKRGASDIGSNSNTYTTVSNDAGNNITCIVTVTTIIDNISATSNALLITAVPSVTAVGTVTKTSNGVISIPFTAPTDNGGATVTSYSIVSTPSIALTYSGTTSPISVTGSFVAEQAYTFTIAAINSAGTGTVSGSSNSIVAMTLIGQALFTTAGSYTWTAPLGITSVSVVCVGSGGGGYLYIINTANNAVFNGGAGGGLGYTNNISVTPNTNYTVVVGAAQAYGHYLALNGGTLAAGQGQYSYFADNTGVINANNMVIGSKYAIVSLGTTTFTSYGALANLTNCVFTATAVGEGTGTVVKIEAGGGGGNGGQWGIATQKSSFAGDGGGWGGGNNSVLASTTGPMGGGGAGGYYNNGTVSGGFGGASAYYSPYIGPTASYGNSGGGGGWGNGGAVGGGSIAASGSAFGGGGVGIYGHAAGGGYAGDNGPGAGGSNGSSGGSYVTSGGHDGGAFGGGGAGGNTAASGAGYSGGGAVRIVWGTGRSFPSTNVNTDI